MEDKKSSYQTIDEYILLFPPEVQEKLQMLRNCIKEAAPEAEEKISWRMPTFVLNGYLIHFAAFKNHIGIYPGPYVIDVFRDRLTEYKVSKGTVQFPFIKEMPYELIAEIVRFKISENINNLN
jgi:uncharacterized protein YdhG (YjbR/CyaY superfamily)